MQACTIIARNYLPQARVLAESFLEHHPDGRLSVLVIDDLESAIRSTAEPFDVLHPNEIGLERAEFHRMAAMYSVLELSTAVKPWLLRHLLADSSDVTYLDPDIQIFKPLDEVSKLARKHSIVLTPHTIDPVPNTESELPETTILIAGMYNLGFIALGPGCDGFLDWWSDRVRRDCIVAPERGRFVDQRWADFVPSLFRSHILRDPTYNVAWWNLTTRVLTSKGRGYLVNGKPLHFFHFSGYSPDQQHLLSTHQGPRPNILLTEHAELARVCAQYARRLADAGYAEHSSMTYGYDALPTGMPIDSRSRRLYREALLRAERKNEPEPPNPFEPEQTDRFVDWLNEPVDRRGSAAAVSRYLTALHAERPDVARAFPNLRWNDAAEYLKWIRTVGRYQERIPFELVPEPRQSQVAATPVDPTELEEGINVAGYFRAELGVGEAARQLIAGIEEAGIPYSTLTYTAAPSRQDHPFEQSDTGSTNYDINLICVNADQVLNFVHDVGPEFLAHRYSIGLWWWEISRFPEQLHDAFDAVNEVWVGSEFAAQAISAETEKPVQVVPLGLPAPPLEPHSRADLGLPDGFVFLFSFDFFSVFERKNPLGVIAAFKRAFPEQEPGGPTLVLKSINGDKNVPDLERLRLAADRPDIRVVDEYVSSAQKNALMASCDCYVSLHRSEGLGLTMAEAMAYGRPVIATAYSGNLAFMTVENSYLVPYRLTEIPAGCDPYPEGVEWAEPDLDEAARLMRHVHANQEEASARGAVAREHIEKRYSPKQTGEFVAARVARIRETTMLATTASKTPPESPPAPTGPRALERATRHVTEGPRTPLDAASRFGAAGQLYRRVLFRLLRPYAVRQRELEVAMLEAIREAESETARVAAEAAERTDKLAGEVRELEHELRDELQRQVERLGRLETSRGRLDELPIRLGAAEAELGSLGPLQAEVAALAAELRAEPYMSEPKLLRTTDSQGREAIGYVRNGQPTPSDDLYRGFEDLFRGSEEMIRDRQRPYLDLIGDRQPVLDVGCGRGEFLDLLAERGSAARGIDIDSGMVEHCRLKGHDVELAEANDYLEEQPDGSLGAIFTSQVIEHMPFDGMMRFFEIARRKLSPDGIFIAETVNPHSIQAMKAFWVDPTHESPIFPEVAAALCWLHGYGSARVVFPNGGGTLERDLFGQGEYAVVATVD